MLLDETVAVRYYSQKYMELYLQCQKSIVAGRYQAVSILL